MSQVETQEPVDETGAALDKIKTMMENPIGFYHTARSDTEMDLVSHVRSKLVEKGLLDKLPECFDQNRFIVEAKDKVAHVQQYLLNRYFNTQLMATEEDTSLERYSLIYEIRPDQWLEVFDKTILPTVVNCNLPVKI